MKSPRHSLAFSLVELSIVLVILGLLVGGVLAGKSLIRAGELRGATTEFQKYQTAFHAFRDRYFAIPGDMANATAFWGSLSGNGTNTTCFNLPASGTATCNGTGNGNIEQNRESFRFWQHLANAGLIEGQYSGLSGDADYAGRDITAVNSPVSKIATGLWWPNENGIMSGVSTFFDGSYGNMLLLGGYYAPGNTNITAIMRPEEAWNIDTKLDDGSPYNGMVVPRRGNTCTSSTATSDTSATYLLSSTAIGCTLVFRRLF